ncbi:MAG: response regulator, partial [Myxococcales bacterium]|nr:response regulator [Myxococcales bacterium]
MSARIRVVDDHAASAEALADVLRDEGFVVDVSHDPREALAALSEQPADVLVTDLRMDGLDGVALMKAARQVDPDLPVVVVTAYATVDRAIQATRAGAFAFVTKPLDPAAITVQVRNAAAQRTLRRVIAASGPVIVGRSVAVLQALGAADRAARTDLPVLITGESGTGK